MNMQTTARSETTAPQTTARISMHQQTTARSETTAPQATTQHGKQYLPRCIQACHVSGAAS